MLPLIAFVSYLSCFYNRPSFIDEFHHSTIKITVCSHVAGDWTETGEALWDAGGVCNHGDRDSARASQLQSKNSADIWLKSKGKKYHSTWKQQTFRNHHVNDWAFREIVGFGIISLIFHSVFWSCVVVNIRLTWKIFSLTWIESMLLVSSVQSMRSSHV